jgi:membrane carboxypeptidase/penicillin-binding protein PbpC
VLGRLVARGTIDAGTSEAAAATELRLAPLDAEPLAPHFVQFVFDELERVRPDLSARPGLIIETTLDLDLQREAVRSVERRIAGLTAKNVTNAAVVVMEPESGRLLAMVGSADFEAPAGQINMALAPRQPGSALKPFLYAAAFEEGYTAQTPLLDVPTTFDTPSGPYTPNNYDLRFHGPTPLRVALASSLNVPAVRTLDDIGVDALLRMAHGFGLESLGAAPAYGLALTLGAGEVPLLDLTAAYAAIAGGGRHAEPVAIVRVRDSAGRVLYEAPAVAPVQVIAREHAFLLADILSDPLARLPAFGEVSPLETSVGAAVKTGTSSFFRDSWALGFTADRTVGVWAGNSDGSTMTNISGVEGAAPIWRDVMEAAARGRPPVPFERPPGIDRVEVCSPTGLLAGPDCPSVVSDWYVTGTAPVEIERYYTRDANGALIIDPPPEARAWALAAGWRVAGAVDASGPPGAAGAVHIVQPGNGSVLYLAPELERDEVVLRASVPAETTQVEFIVNGSPVAAIEGNEASAIWLLDAGWYELEVVAHLPDGSTALARSRYEVRVR